MSVGVALHDLSSYYGVREARCSACAVLTVIVELLEMSPDGFFGRRMERRRETRVNSGHDFRRRAAARLERGGNLLFSFVPMPQVFVDQRTWIVDRGPVRGQQPSGPEFTHTMERPEVIAQAAAFAGGDNDGAADSREVPAEEIARGLIEETEMIGGVAGRMDRAQTSASSVDPLAILKRITDPTAANDHRRPSREQIRHTSHMVDVVMREKYEVQRSGGEPLRNRVDVLGPADAGIYQRGRGTGEEVGVIACRPRPLRGVAGRERDHHGYQ